MSKENNRKPLAKNLVTYVTVSSDGIREPDDVSSWGFRRIGTKISPDYLPCYALPFNPTTQEVDAIFSEFGLVYVGNCPTIPWVGVWYFYDGKQRVPFASFMAMEYHIEYSLAPLPLETIGKAVEVFLEQ